MGRPPCEKLAELIGEGATVGSIEWQFRMLRKLSLLNDKNGDNGDVKGTPRKRGRKTSDVKSEDLDGSPTKKQKASPVKGKGNTRKPREVKQEDSEDTLDDGLLNGPFGEDGCKVEDF